MMKLPRFQHSQPPRELGREFVQWRMDIAEPLPVITREELLRRLWIIEEVSPSTGVSFFVDPNAEAVAAA